MSAALTCDVGTSAVVRARVQIPAWGRWWIDVDLEDDLTIPVGTPVSVTLGGTQLTCAIVSGGSAYGRAAYRAVAGTDGWSAEVGAQGYRDAGGVSAALVIKDVAALVGESVASLPDTRICAHYARRSGRAIETLNALAPQAWYVGLDGVTRFGARTTSNVASNDPIVERSPSTGSITIETSDVTPYLPGAIVESYDPAVDVEYSLSSSRLSVKLFFGPRSSRELDAFRRVFDTIDPLRAYRTPAEYRVVTQDGAALDLQPVRVSAGLPDLERVPVRFTPLQLKHKLGSLVVVAFVEADPSRPIVIAGDDPDAPGGVPDELYVDAADLVTVGTNATMITLGAAPQLGVARIGDSVQAGPYTGVITGGSSTVKAGT